MRLKRLLLASPLLMALLPQWSQTSNAETWKVSQSREIAEHEGVRHVLLECRFRGRTVDVHLVLFHADDHMLQVIDNPDGNQVELDEAMRRANCIAGVNGGFFHPDFTPLGLVVADGERVHDAERASLLSGLVAANDHSFHILRPEEFRLGPKTRHALQAGPFLIDDGRPVEGLNADKRARRTAILHDGDAGWALAAIEPVTLHDAATLLASDAMSHWIRPKRALNLDGGSSSALWFRGTDNTGAFHMRPLTRIRNYLGVKKR